MLGALSRPPHSDVHHAGWPSLVLQGQGAELRAVLGALSRPTRIVKGKGVDPAWTVDPALFELQVGVRNPEAEACFCVGHRARVRRRSLRGGHGVNPSFFTTQGFGGVRGIDQNVRPMTSLIIQVLKLKCSRGLRWPYVSWAQCFRLHSRTRLTPESNLSLCLEPGCQQQGGRPLLVMAVDAEQAFCNRKLDSRKPQTPFKLHSHKSQRPCTLCCTEGGCTACTPAQPQSETANFLLLLRRRLCCRECELKTEIEKHAFAGRGCTACGATGGAGPHG